MTIRETTADDAPEVQRVARASWHAAYDDLIGEQAVDETVNSWFDPENVAADVNRSGRPFYVVEVDGEVQGFVVAVPDEDREATYRLYRISVHPDWWGEGLGTDLLDHLQGELRSEGIERLRLSVLGDNERAIEFYESRGFERVGEEYDERFDGPRYTYAKNL